MTHGDMTKKLWPGMLQYLLLGNGLVNNLSEPQVQLDELREKLPQFCEYLANHSIEQGKKQLAYNELERQLKYMNTFAEQLTAVIQEFTQLLEGDAS